MQRVPDQWLILTGAIIHVLGDCEPTLLHWQGSVTVMTVVTESISLKAMRLVYMVLGVVTGGQGMFASLGLSRCV
jgi:hypothetical protein